MESQGNPTESQITISNGQIPQWFESALAAPFETGNVDVAGVSINYQAWGEQNRPGVLLIHGGAAHSHWWDHIAPLLAKRHRVVAIDLSGHGASGRRENYTFDLWVEEVMSVTRNSSMAINPILIGHSLGGMVALHAAKQFGAQLRGTVAIDSGISRRAPEEEAEIQQIAFGPLHVYPEREEILQRFRTIPEQEVLPFISAHVAENSIRKVEGGWSWKFDPRIFDRTRGLPASYASFECRVTIFRAEKGIISENMAEIMYENMGKVVPIIEIPNAGHAAMLDQPLALVTGLRTLIAEWEHSLPAL